MDSQVQQPKIIIKKQYPWTKYGSAKQNNLENYDSLALKKIVALSCIMNDPIEVGVHLLATRFKI